MHATTEVALFVSNGIKMTGFLDHENREEHAVFWHNLNGVPRP